MEHVLFGGNTRIPIKSWCSRDTLESNAIEQAVNLSNLPFTFKHIALMPDCHSGYGMPIGGVMATHNVVVPNAVGVDIGCGMCATKLLDHIPCIDTLKKIMGDIRKVIPVGFNKHNEAQESMILYDVDADKYPIVYYNLSNAAKSLGTLGGGNHFIELQADRYSNLWVMIHSGSRNVGKQVCDFYNKKAKELNQMWYSVVDPKWDLAFLPLDLTWATDYLNEMQWCVDYAFCNRHLMLQRIMEVFSDNNLAMEHEDTINIAHNYAKLENHFSRNVMVHRKGATLARKGTIGIIPGSQGTASYIVEGLGNQDSFTSCSHGAGRKMGRKQACRELDLEYEKMRLDEIGIIHSIRNESDLDEAAGAYKDIDEVMDNQKDLVKIV